MNIAIIASRFNQFIVDQLLEGVTEAPFVEARFVEDR